MVYIVCDGYAELAVLWPMLSTFRHRLHSTQSPRQPTGSSCVGKRSTPALWGYLTSDQLSVY